MPPRQRPQSQRTQELQAYSFPAATHSSSHRRGAATPTPASYHAGAAQPSIASRRRSLSDPFARALLPPPGETSQQRDARIEAETRAKQVSDDIDKIIKRDRDRSGRKQKENVKVLLLGQSESGKSTTLKQFQLLHTPAQFRAERLAWRAVIYLNLVRSIRRILEVLAPDAEDAEEYADIDDASLISAGTPRDSVILVSASSPHSSGVTQTRPGFIPQNIYETYRQRLEPLLPLEEGLIKMISEDTEEDAASPEADNVGHGLAGMNLSGGRRQRGADGRFIEDDGMSGGWTGFSGISTHPTVNFGYTSPTAPHFDTFSSYTATTNAHPGYHGAGTRSTNMTARPRPTHPIQTDLSSSHSASQQTLDRRRSRPSPTNPSASQSSPISPTHSDGSNPGASQSHPHHAHTMSATNSGSTITSQSHSHSMFSASTTNTHSTPYTSYYSGASNASGTLMSPISNSSGSANGSNGSGTMLPPTSSGTELSVRTTSNWRSKLSLSNLTARSTTSSKGSGSRNPFGAGGGGGGSGGGGELMGWWEDPSDPVHVVNGCAQAMMDLWRDERVRVALRERRVRLEESSGFFLDEIGRITAKRYMPTDDDVLRARLKTTGVVEHSFTLTQGHERGVEWKIYDVGGSRNQRQAWAPYFDDVNAIIFLAPISAFDQVLAEDATMNRLEDSILLWRSVVSNKLLENVNIVLFLNKCDLLESKLSAGIKLNHHMLSYGDRPNDYESVSKYFRHKFVSWHQAYTPNPHRELYVHLTCVTDTRKTSSVILNVRDLILRANLKSSRLI